VDRHESESLRRRRRSGAEPLSLGEAKERLVEAAEECDVFASVRHNPRAALLVALSTGMVLGAFPLARRTVFGGLAKVLRRL
jgi:hypothetical protein